MSTFLMNDPKFREKRYFTQFAGWSEFDYAEEQLEAWLQEHDIKPIEIIVDDLESFVVLVDLHNYMNADDLQDDELYTLVDRSAFDVNLYELDIWTTPAWLAFDEVRP